MIKIYINDLEYEVIEGQREANYTFDDVLEIPADKINDIDYIAVELAENVEYDGKGECVVFVSSVDYVVIE